MIKKKVPRTIKIISIYLIIVSVFSAIDILSELINENILLSIFYLLLIVFAFILSINLLQSKKWALSGMTYFSIAMIILSFINILFLNLFYIIHLAIFIFILIDLNKYKFNDNTKQIEAKK